MPLGKAVSRSVSPGVNADAVQWMRLPDRAIIPPRAGAQVNLVTDPELVDYWKFRLADAALNGDKEWLCEVRVLVNAIEKKAMAW